MIRCWSQAKSDKDGPCDKSSEAMLRCLSSDLVAIASIQPFSMHTSKLSFSNIFMSLASAHTKEICAQRSPQEGLTRKNMGYYTIEETHLWISFGHLRADNGRNINAGDVGVTISLQAARNLRVADADLYDFNALVSSHVGEQLWPHSVVICEPIILERAASFLAVERIPVLRTGQLRHLLTPFGRNDTGCPPNEGK